MNQEGQDIRLKVPTGDIRRLDQYFGQWAILEDRMRAMLDTVQGTDLFAHVTANKERRRARAKIETRAVAWSEPAENSVAGAGGGVAGVGGRGPGSGRSGIVNIAIVDVVGPITKYGSSMSDFPGCVEMERTIRNLARDSSVGAIMLRVHSPGGTTDGVEALAGAIRDAAAIKPVGAYGWDLMASAAYWLASQGTLIWAGRSAIVGSIGTYMVIYDSSAWADAVGIKVHVIRAGEMKGAGTPGTEVTDSQRADFQRVIDSLNDVFVADVATGRGISADEARALADGRVHVGAMAVELGLIDGIATFDEALSQLAGKAGLATSTQASAEIAAVAHSETATMANKKTGETTAAKAEDPKKDEETSKAEDEEKKDEETSKAEETEEEDEEEEETTDSKSTASASAASIGELEAAFPKSTADWKLKCLKAGLSVAQAKAMYTEATAEAPAPRAPGNHRPIRAGAAAAPKSVTGSTTKDQMQGIANKLREENKGLSREQAWARACRENPELRAKMVAEINEQYGGRIPA
jgi:protease-4